MSGPAIQSLDLGPVVGPQGPKGDTGDPGASGVVVSRGPSAGTTWDTDDTQAIAQVTAAYDPALYTVVVDLERGRIFVPEEEGGVVTWTIDRYFPMANGHLFLGKFAESTVDPIDIGTPSGTRVAYRKGAVGGVVLSFSAGNISFDYNSQTQGPIFTVPNGWRPKMNVIVPCVVMTGTTNEHTTSMGLMSIHSNDGGCSLQLVASGHICGLVCEATYAVQDW